MHPRANQNATCVIAPLFPTTLIVIALVICVIAPPALIFNFSIASSTLIGWYISNGADQPLYFDSNIQGPPSKYNFYANIYPFARCLPEDTGTNTKPLYMHGSVIEDTLYYDLFFYNTLDTCKGFKQGDFRL